MDKPQKYYSTDQVIELFESIRGENEPYVDTIVDNIVRILEKQRPQIQPTWWEKIKLKINK